ncbi:MAG TPA: response regulator [Hyphomicrobiaceae bacterium]|nr:response regulator [Hyphomicrobiaceae bacterium]
MKQCLVVDDSDIIRTVARRILEKLRMEVSEAVDGQQALERCSSRMPDAILLDWDMPGMSGIDFLVRLSSLQGKRPFVIYCTTENDPTNISLAFAAGADDYLLKPYDTRDISAKLGSAGLL